MSALSRRAVTGACLAVGTAAALGLAAGGIRLLPWLWSPEVPLEVALPFARALGAAATETALMFGLPISVTLVRVALTLAAFSALNLAAAAASDAAHRARFVRPMIDEVVRGLDAREAYLVARSRQARR